MAEDASAHPPTQPAEQREVESGIGPPRTDGRCDQCGYALVGLPRDGTCPECGSHYNDPSARRLQPWPSAGKICLRLGWPFIGLVAVTAMASAGRNDATAVAGIFLGWAFTIAVPINSYFQVRSMLKTSLPEQKRTRGPIFAMRAIGTTICVMLFIGLLAPFIFFVGCLIVLSGSGGFH